MPSTARRRAAPCALILAPLLAPAAPSAADQPWSPQLLNRFVSSQVAIQDGPGGPIDTAIDELSGYAEHPIPARTLDVAAALDSFGAAASAHAALLSSVDEQTFALVCAVNAIASSNAQALPQALAYGTFWFVFELHVPSFVRLDITASAALDNTLLPGFGSGSVVLRPFTLGEPIASFALGAPDKQPALLTFAGTLNPGRYELVGSVSAGAGILVDPGDQAADAAFEVILQVPAPSALAPFAFAALAGVRRRR